MIIRYVQVVALLVLCFAANSAYSIDKAKIAPLSEDEFYRFFDEYRAFAGCIDALGVKQGLNSKRIAQKLVGSGEADELVVKAKAILTNDGVPASSLKLEDTDAEQRVQLAMAALTGVAQTQRDSRTRYLVTMGMARIFIARASDGSCGPSKTFIELFDKARK